MKSKIHTEEVVENKDRRFGQALHYYPCHIEDKDGNIVNALFTDDQINDAIKRADENPEDITEKSIWELIFGKK